MTTREYNTARNWKSGIAVSKALSLRTYLHCMDSTSHMLRTCAKYNRHCVHYYDFTMVAKPSRLSH